MEKENVALMVFSAGFMTTNYLEDNLQRELPVIIVMNLIKTMWGRMRFREMTDPLVEFTRWYVITDRGGFDNAYASFPSGHTKNSAAVILLTLLPSFLTKLRGREKALKGITVSDIV